MLSLSPVEQSEVDLQGLMDHGPRFAAEGQRRRRARRDQLIHVGTTDTGGRRDRDAARTGGFEGDARGWILEEEEDRIEDKFHAQQRMRTSCGKLYATPVHGTTATAQNDVAAEVDVLRPDPVAAYSRRHGPPRGKPSRSQRRAGTRIAGGDAGYVENLFTAEALRNHSMKGTSRAPGDGFFLSTTSQNQKAESSQVSTRSIVGRSLNFFSTGGDDGFARAFGLKQRQPEDLYGHYLAAYQFNKDFEDHTRSDYLRLSAATRRGDFQVQGSDPRHQRLTDTQHHCRQWHRAYNWRAEEFLTATSSDGEDEGERSQQRLPVARPGSMLVGGIDNPEQRHLAAEIQRRKFLKMRYQLLPKVFDAWASDVIANRVPDYYIQASLERSLLGRFFRSWKACAEVDEHELSEESDPEEEEEESDE